MRVMNHNWSATKQHLHPQSVAKIRSHSVLSGDKIRQRETSSGSCHKDTDQLVSVSLWWHLKKLPVDKLSNISFLQLVYVSLVYYFFYERTAF